MKILVTGCAGFIGSSLTIRLLMQNHIVTGIDNFDPFYSKSLKEKNLEPCFPFNGFRFIQGDITGQECFRAIKDDIDCVIHLAAKAGVRQSIKFPGEYIKCNISGTQNLLQWMTSRKIRKYIFASSSSIYGDRHTLPFSESENVNETISPYAFTKKSGEILNYTYHHLYNIDTINLRFFTVYGPKQRPDLAIRKFTDSIISGNPVVLYGDGDTSRDYTFIDDIVDGIVSSVRLVTESSNIFETINLGNCSPVSLNELVKVLSDALGREPVIKHEKLPPGDVHCTCADITKAGKLLSWSPRVPLSEGIKKFTDWYLANYNVYSAPLTI